MEYRSSLKVGEMTEVFVEHPLALVDSKGLNSLPSFFIFGELMIKIVLEFARVRLFRGAVMVGATEKPHEKLR